MLFQTFFRIQGCVSENTRMFALWCLCSSDEERWAIKTNIINKLIVLIEYSMCYEKKWNRARNWKGDIGL